MDEFGMDEQGRLNFFGVPGASGAGPPGSPWDEAVLAGWDPADYGDPLTDLEDDEDAWLRSMPADLRAEVMARPALPAPTAGHHDASLLDQVGGPSAFSDGAFCDTMLPGSVLGDMLATVTSSGLGQLSDDVLVGMLRGWQRQISHTQSQQARLVAELTRRRLAESRLPGWSRIADHVVDELRIELTLTAPAARRLADVVHGLARLTKVNDALLSGFIDWSRACVFVDELAVLGDGLAQEIAERLTERAAAWTTGQLRAALQRAVLAADPQAAERRKRNARHDTRVDLWREESGNAALAGRELGPTNAITLARKLDSDADWLSACGVPGTRGQLRALAFTTLLSGRELTTILDDPSSWPQAVYRSDATDEREADGDHARGNGNGNVARPAMGRDAAEADASGPSQPSSIHLTLPLSTWLGGGDPGEVAGYGLADGPTSRELGRLLARDPATRWCLTLTGADGQAIAHACARRGPLAGEPVIRWAASLRPRMQMLECETCTHARQSAGYVPPSKLRHLVMIRQRRCSFPGCRRPATRCDLDHTVPFDSGGLTCECNLAPLCRRHHRAKQAPRWRLAQDQPGHMTWRLPSGREYQTTGEPYAG